MNTFTIDLPLPTGALLVEASAGTGKTWSIARLVARLLAEDPPEGGAPPTIDQVLVVTYTRAATAELRDRIRRVLVEAEGILILARQGAAVRPEDPAFCCLAGVTTASGWSPFPHAVLDGRIARLRAAVRDFDTASISTIHGFCQRVLTTLAFESESSFDGELLNDDTEMLESIVDDWMARTFVPADDSRYGWLKSVVQLSRSRLIDIARKALGARGGARVLPAPSLDWREHLDARAAGAAALAERFRSAEGAELVAALATSAASGSSNRTWYAEAKIFKHAEAFLAWLEAGALPSRKELAEGPLRLFRQSFVVEKTTTNGVPLHHPLLAAVDDWVETFDAAVFDGPIAEFAAHVLVEHAERLRRTQSQTFDDLLLSVQTRLDRPELIEGLRRRFRVALIDEFQDTDAAQWEIFRRAFMEDPAGRLVLIGDPKQAIYAFRGADVSVYAEARGIVPDVRQFTMKRNFRTDKPALDALDAVFREDPNIFVTEAIKFEQVAAHTQVPRLVTQDGTPVLPLVVRWFDGEILDVGDKCSVSNTLADQALPPLLAQDVLAELTQGWMRVHEDGDPRPLRARDIAVLTGTNRVARAVQASLLAAGIPAIISQAGSVYATEESQWLERWLAALMEPGRDGPARALAITPLFGWTAPELLAGTLGGDDAERWAEAWSRFLDALAHHSALLVEESVIVAVSALLHDTSEPDGRTPMARLASLPDGERRLTNLRHLSELLHEAALTERLGAAGLHRWLRDRRQRNDADSETAELRLESDADTVQVVTVHKSKGLEYPVVFAPFLWDGRLLRGLSPDTNVLQFHRPGETRLTVDLRGRVGADPTDTETALGEMLEEHQRLLYVAVTRAKHRVVLYTGPTTGKSSQDLQSSPLGLLFHGRSGGGTRASNAVRNVSPFLKDEPLKLREQIERVTLDHPGHIRLENAGDAVGNGGPLPGSTGAVPPVVASFTRVALDREWRRESYTGLVGQRKGALLDTDPHALPENTRDHDDGDGSASVVPIHEPADGVPAGAAEVPLRTFPGGAEAGTWVHAVFEATSFCTPDPDLPQIVRRHGLRNGFPRPDKDAVLLTAWPDILHTPLGSAFGDRCLADIPDKRRLNELVFDLPIGPGDRWVDHLPLAGRELAAALGAPRADSPVSPAYLAFVREMGFRPLCGFLTGTIDLIFSMEVNGRERWFVADYKTNTLGPRARGADGAPTGRVLRSAPGHYSAPWMAAEIAKKHYYVQYLLYLVALHRYLRSRIRGYSYETHVGGAVYLFVRGMVGAETARDAGGVNGVFFDRPPESVIEGLSQLLARTEVRS